MRQHRTNDPDDREPCDENSLMKVYRTGKNSLMKVQKQAKNSLMFLHYLVKRHHCFIPDRTGNEGSFTA